MPIRSVKQFLSRILYGASTQLVLIADGMEIQVPASPEEVQVLLRRFGYRQLTKADIPELAKYPGIGAKEIIKAIQWAGDCRLEGQ